MDDDVVSPDNPVSAVCGKVTRRSRSGVRRWAGAAVGLAALGLIACSPARVPACNSERVLSTLRSGALAALASELRTDPMAAMRGAADGHQSMAQMRSLRLEQAQEITYLETERTRVCRAEANIGEHREEIGFLIRADESGDIFVEGAEPNWLRAKYAATEDAGAPIGAEAITAAFRAASAESEAAASSMRRRARSFGAENEVKIDQEVLPLAPCGIEDGGLAVCDILFQHHDRLIGVLGGNDVQLVRGDFSFVQEGGVWRVSDKFPEEFTTAVVRGRVEGLFGDEAGERMRARTDQ